MGWVASRAQLVEEVHKLRQIGRSIVFTNGYFDLLHVGHLNYLRQAKALGDVLVVAVNADETARSSKDPRRPIIPEGERAELVAALDCVDYAVIFGEATATALVDALRPEVYVKGGDYAPTGASAPPEAASVRAYGGNVVILPLLPDHSTTDTIERILTRYGPQTPS